MSDPQSHVATTTDGVEIVGAVHGQGPSLVFVPGGVGDGDLDWRAVLPYLTERFTCHLPSFRGRGLSGEHPDLRSGRLSDDLVTYIDSVNETVGLVGWSAGGMVLSVAARSDAVGAVVAVEPTMFSLIDDEARAVLGQAVTGMRELAAEGRLAQAARAFFTFPFNDAEIAAVDATGYFDAIGRYVPTLLDQLAQTRESTGPAPDDPAMLSSISAAVLVLHGSDTKPLFSASARHVAAHVPGATLREIPGVGHAAPLTHPAMLAEAFTEFFLPAQQPT